MAFEFEERLAERAVPAVGDKVIYYRDGSPTPNAAGQIEKIDDIFIYVVRTVGRIGRGHRARSITQTDMIKSSQIARITHKLGEY